MWGEPSTYYSLMDYEEENPKCGVCGIPICDKIDHIKTSWGFICWKCWMEIKGGEE